MAIKLNPCMTDGMAFLWMGVGKLYPLALMALMTAGDRLKAVKPPPEADGRPLPLIAPTYLTASLF